MGAAATAVSAAPAIDRSAATPTLGVVAPARHLALFALTALLIAASSLWAGLQTPEIDLKVQRVGATGSVMLIGPGAIVSGKSELRFSSPGRPPLVFQAEEIADDAAPKGGRANSILYWSRLAELARMLGTGRAELHFVDRAGHARSHLVAVSPRTLATLGLHYWSAWATAMLALLIGLWVWAVRRHDWASRQFALLSVGIFVSAIPLALAGDTPLATPLWRWLLVVNTLGAMLFGSGMVGMLMRFPCPLLHPRWATVTLLACLASTIVHLLELAEDSYQFIGIVCVVIFAGLLVLLVAQVIAARQDPTARRAIRTIAIVSGTVMTVVVAITIVPIVLRSEQPLHTAIVFPLLLVIHLGIAAAVTRTRLVTMESWAGAATRGAAVVALRGAVDLLIVAIAWAAAGPRVAAVAAAIAAAHVALRTLLGRRRDARARQRERELLRRITQLSLAVDAAARQALWVEALDLAFAPLAIDSDAEDGGSDRPFLSADGRALHMPCTAATGALVLSHAEGGGRRFDAQHLGRADELHALLVSTTRARDEYVRGVTEERLRIARDLHDDIGARLMTSLHRDDRETMRQDVRDAISDIRLIVGNLAGDARLLGDVLADLRHETAMRLGGADILLDWPPGAGLLGLPDHLDGSAARHLTSIVRELTSNAIRHAAARSVTVRVEAGDDRLSLSFADDGAGLSQAGRGNGLRNLQRRAAALGGSIRFDPPPGFCATLTLPRAAAAAYPAHGMAAAAAQP